MKLYRLMDDGARLVSSEAEFIPKGTAYAEPSPFPAGTRYSEDYVRFTGEQLREMQLFGRERPVRCLADCWVGRTPEEAIDLFRKAIHKNLSKLGKKKSEIQRQMDAEHAKLERAAALEKP